MILLTPSQANGDVRYKFVGFGCDVSSELDVQNAFAQVLETFGRLGAVVASAGVRISRHRSKIAHEWATLSDFPVALTQPNLVIQLAV